MEETHKCFSSAGHEDCVMADASSKSVGRRLTILILDKEGALVIEGQNGGSTEGRDAKAEESNFEGSMRNGVKCL